MTSTTWKPAELSQLKQIRLLSATYFSDNDAIFKQIGKPVSREDASMMLKALDPLPLSATIADLRKALPDGIKLERKDESTHETRSDQEETMADPQTRKCDGCSKSKPRSQYRKDGRTQDGLSKLCKDCHREFHKERHQPKPKPTSTSGTPQPAENGKPEVATLPRKPHTPWTTAFYNPTLVQLRLLAEFLGGATLDETADVCNEIVGVFDE